MIPLSSATALIPLNFPREEESTLFPRNLLSMKICRSTSRRRDRSYYFGLRTKSPTELLSNPRLAFTIAHHNYISPIIYDISLKTHPFYKELHLLSSEGTPFQCYSYPQQAPYAF